MGTLTILGRDYSVAPLSLGKMRKAAVYIDQVNETAGAITTLEGMIESAGFMCAVVAIAVSTVDPEITQAHLEDVLTPADLPALRDAFLIVLEDAGLAPKGEVKAPAVDETTAGALPINSEISSTS